MKLKKLNNKGSTLVLVIIVLAIVSVLAVVALWISLYNFQMKVTDKNVKDNFYSAETVLDQIRVGLQGDVSKAYENAYTDIMQNYNSIGSDASEDFAEVRKVRFEKNFLKSLVNLLKSDENGYTYSVDKLRNYVSPEIVTDGTLDSTKPHAKIETTTATDGGTENGLLNSYYPKESKLALKGVKVTYTDTKGYTSIIETDICMGCPNLNFVNSGELPDTFSFSMIGNQGIKLSDASNKISISGSVYAGSNFVLDSSKTSADDVLSLKVGKNVDVSFENLKYLIAQGTIFVDGSESKLKVAEDSQVWTENIELNSASIKLLGNTYLSDDLTLNGDSPKAVLGNNNSGKYIGYGNASKAAGSSSIIVNGKNSSLDLSGLNELFLAGYSYINTGSISTHDNTKTNSDINMASSISLKGDQIAYLVPGECIGVDSEGISKFGKNPLTYVEYREITSSDNHYKMVDGTVVSGKTKKSLDSYIDNGLTVMQSVSTVFVPSSSGNSNDGLVYFYINLSSDMAKQYYSDFYDNNRNKLGTYADFYANVIQTNKTSTIYTAGKYSLYESDVLDVMPEGKWSEQKVNDQIATVTNMYYSLRTTLTSNSTSESEMTSIVFNNIINEAKLKEVTNGKTQARQLVTYKSEDGAQNYSAILVDNGGIVASDLDLASVMSNNPNANIRLVVSTGNVLVNTDFEGTIVAKGKIVVTGSHSIKAANVDEIKRLLSADIDKKMKLYDVFMEGESYLTSTNNSDENQNISYNELITYQNWKKE